MLMHEWIRYRNQQVKPGSTVEQDVRPEEEARPESQAPMELTPGADEAKPEPAEAAEPETRAEVAPAADEAAAEISAVTEPTVSETPADTTTASDAQAQAARSPTDSAAEEREELVAALEQEVERAGENLRERFRQLQARQKQLPIDVEETAEEPEASRPRRAGETREELVQRLLDPTLTLREAALLLDVCPATVRRYTNRGLLKCFRTPGNQRRFRLTDLLDFMERREQAEL